MPQFPVVLNVYDMYWINNYTFNIGLGVFHSGVVVHGKEYAYGGHPYEWSGIFDMFPKCAEMLGPEFKFRESIVIGMTDFSSEDIDHIVNEMGSKFTGVSYHLVDKNCNHFTSEFTQVSIIHVNIVVLLSTPTPQPSLNWLLCGKAIPNWVNRLANAGSYFPFLLKCLPKEWIRP
ncbi:predicted protein, partial [Nematostella vectensis]